MSGVVQYAKLVVVPPPSTPHQSTLNLHIWHGEGTVHKPIWSVHLSSIADPKDSAVYHLLAITEDSGEEVRCGGFYN